MKRTSRLLSDCPNNSWLRGKLFIENKKYKQLLKLKQKHYIETLFSQLDQIHKSDPKGYMELINSLRNGSFDKVKPSETGAIDPDVWLKHFSDLMGKVQEPNKKDGELKMLFNKTLITLKLI